jgi:hypothetical protein
METAHRKGLLHRDVKPDNVLLTDYGWRLGDFGLARRDDDVLSADVMATLAHASPELIDSGPSVASDVYALGSTLFVALTGRPAFARDPNGHTMSLLRRIENDPVPDMPSVPQPVADVVRRAMAKAPADRFASAADLGMALQDAQRRAGVAVTPLQLPATNPMPAQEPLADPELTVDNRTPHKIGGLTEAVIRDRDAPPPQEEPPEETTSPTGPDRRMLLTVGAVLGVVALIVAALALRGGDDDTDGAGATTTAPTTAEPPPSTVEADMIQLAEDWQFVQMTTDACIGADAGPCPLDDGFFPYFSVDCPPAEDPGGFGRSLGQTGEPSCTISFMELEPAEASFDGSELFASFTSSTPPGGGLEIERGPACLDVPATYSIDLFVEAGEVRDGQLTAIQLRGDLKISVDSPTDPSCGSYYDFSDYVVEAAS